MGRNIALQILRGIQANAPALNDGEFYFATDTGNLFVGLGGGNLRLEANMAIQLVDGVVSTQIASVEPAGTAGTYFLMVKTAQDSDRVKKIFSLTKGTGITTEALVSLTIKSGDATPTTSTSYTVTAGKTLRLQSIFLGVTNITSAAVANVAIRVREGAAGGGAVSVTSDIIAELEAGGQSATLQTSGQNQLTWPDGIEIAGGQQIGISELADSVDAAVTIVMHGFEY